MATRCFISAAAIVILVRSSADGTFWRKSSNRCSLSGSFLQRGWPERSIVLRRNLHVSATIPISPRKFADRSGHDAWSTGRERKVAGWRAEPDSAAEVALREPGAPGGHEL